jgi:hypothetical protein
MMQPELDLNAIREQAVAMEDRFTAVLMLTETWESFALHATDAQVGRVIESLEEVFRHLTGGIGQSRRTLERLEKALGLNILDWREPGVGISETEARVLVAEVERR